MIYLTLEICCPIAKIDQQGFSQASDWDMEKKVIIGPLKCIKGIEGAFSVSFYLNDDQQKFFPESVPNSSIVLFIRDGYFLYNNHYWMQVVVQSFENESKSQKSDHLEG